MTFRFGTSQSSSPTVSTDPPAEVRVGPGRRVAVLATACVHALALSGCVSAADGPSPTDPHLTTTTVAPTTTVTVALEDALTDFEDCMSDAGVDIAGIRVDGRGRPMLARALSDVDLSDRLVVAALGECAPELAGGAMDLSSDRMMLGAVMVGLGEFASCMRSNGVPEFPDPSPRFSGVGSPFPNGLIPWSDSDLATAVIVCSRALVTGT